MSGSPSIQLGYILMRMKTTLTATAFSLIFLSSNAIAQTPQLPNALHHPNASNKGMVVAEERIAASIGADILEAGGNAVDAAVATAFALSVTYPRAGNIGGGGFMLVHMRETKDTTAIDYRETAPGAASRDMFLDNDGAVDDNSVRYTHKAAGVPGTVAGLLHAQKKYGRLSRKAVMAPAIRLAEKGFQLSYFNVAMLEAERERLVRNPAAKAEFFKADGSGYLPGEVMRRRELAKTLKLIAKKGRAGFYDGPVADAISDDMAANGGLITLEDLAAYKVIERVPVKGVYRGVEIFSMPPPSSGGVHLIQVLNMLETRPPYTSYGDSADAIHFLAEAMRRAFADRAEHLGDPDYVETSAAGLISKAYGEHLAALINPERAANSSDIRAGDPAPYESPDTTHISIIDKDGNMVSNTYTLNLSFGSGIVVPGYGILLNNEMDDFSAKPGTPNYYGLVGNEKNAITAGKRPLSSMTPVLLFKDGEPFMSTGAPGGARIISSVIQVIVNVIDRGMNIGDATDATRIHHQWLPDRLYYEPGLSEDTKHLLKAKGHETQELDWFARPQTVLYQDGWFYGYSDERMPGGAACGVEIEC